ncbi:nucleic acid-binding OB-fold [Apiospora kogelbergensis]|uniref:Nucleic acid-binding OB-fold n=1 Tax=Apiospora kogelbergensis TaxID=1337665 RepID=A0AAW0QEX3_9PEZI
MAPKKLVIFAGAPEDSSLQHDGPGLLDAFLEPHTSFMHGRNPLQRSKISNPENGHDTAAWRSIPLHRGQLHTGFSQVHELSQDYVGHGNFFSSMLASCSFDETGNGTTEMSQSLLNDFYNHSLAIHEDVRSSQLPPESYGSASQSFTTTLSYDDSFSDGSSSQADRTLGLGSARLSNLCDIPNASHLNAIQPQTMSVNLIVGIISIAEPRTITTKWGASKTLIELSVGDETKTGFSITFWLAADGDAQNETDAILRDLRRRDVVLLRNIALSEFKTKVHGHSLRKGLSRIQLLYRQRLDEDDKGGFYGVRDLTSRSATHPQALKTARVRQWVLDFVAQPVYAGHGNRQGLKRWELPPDDTQ